MDSRSVPLGVLQVVVEPSKQDLFWGQSQELLQSLVLVQQSVQLRVEFDVNLAQKTPPDDLPDQSQNQMFSNLDDISTANVDNGTADALCRLDDNVVVLRHVEGIERLDLLSGLVHDTLVDGVGHTVVDELGQDEAVLALVEHFKGVEGERQFVANVGVAGENGINVASEFGTLVFVDGVLGAGGCSSDVDATTTDAAFGGVARTRGRGTSTGGLLQLGIAEATRTGGASGHLLLGLRRLSDFGD